MNQIISRRNILRSVALFPAGYMLAGCAAGSGTNTVTTIAAAIHALGQEAVLVLPQLEQYGLSAASAVTVNTALTNIESVAAAISNAATATDGQSTLIKIEASINAVAPLIIPFVSLIPGGAAIGLIVAALPAIEFAVNMAVSLLTPAAVQLAASAPAVAPAAGRVGAGVSAAERAQPYLQLLLAKPPA